MLEVRCKELKMLEHTFQENGPRMVCLVGSHGVGKTDLACDFCASKQNGIFFSAVPGGSDFLLSRFVQALKRVVQIPRTVLEDSTWEGLFLHVFRCAEKGKMILVLDDYPLLAKSVKSLPGIIASLWKSKKASCKLFLLLVMDTRGDMPPCKGDDVICLPVDALDFHAATQLLKHSSYTKEEMYEIWSITGGMPWYVRAFTNQHSINACLEEIAFDRDGALFHETFLPRWTAIRDHGSLMMICQAIARGIHSSSALAHETHCSTACLSAQLKTLERQGIVERRRPCFEDVCKKASWYLSSSLVEFWFLFVFPFYDEIVQGYAARAVANWKSQRNLFLKRQLPRLSMEYLHAVGAACQGMQESLWWKQQDELLDFIMRDAKGRYVLGYCPSGHGEVSNEDIREISEDGAGFGKNERISKYVFLYGVASPSIREVCSGKGNCMLVELDEMLKTLS